MSKRIVDKSDFTLVVILNGVWALMKLCFLSLMCRITARGGQFIFNIWEFLYPQG